MSRKCVELALDGMKTFLSKIDTVLFDCDGVLWHSSFVIPKAADLIKLLKQHGKRVFYITNNSSKTRADFVEKLVKSGFPADVDEVVCTAHVAAVYLKNRDFKDKVYLIGPKSMEKELDENGIRWTTHSDSQNVSYASFNQVGESVVTDPEVRCVLVGADLRFNYEKLSRACLYLYRNDDCMFIGTNCDAQFPLKDGRAVPGTGALVHAVAYASGRKPIWIGKPDRPVFDFLRENHRINPERTLMVGDRLGTDIKLAVDNGLQSLLVLTGMHQVEDVRHNQQSDDPELRKLVPDYYIESVTKLAEYIRQL